MGKLLCESTTVQETFPTVPLFDQSPKSTTVDPISTVDLTTWHAVPNLEDQQRRNLQRLETKGVLWRNGDRSEVFRLSHGGEVSADGNCLFTATERAMAAGVADVVEAKELRRRVVRRFVEGIDLNEEEKGVVEGVIKGMYCPDLKSGWGVHVVQEVKLLAKKCERVGLDTQIDELVNLGMQRELAAESIYKERCIPVSDGPSWAKYMSISGSPDDEYDIITLQYTEEGLLSVEENRDGRAAAFGDDIAIECLATEFKREVYVVQAHGSDAMVDEENCVFFLPHRPRSEICAPPLFLFMKGTGWCGAGGDHYEPLISHTSSISSQEKVAVVL